MPGGSAQPIPLDRTLAVMSRRDSYLLLGVLGVGVFLAGLELMVTAVALPQILATMANWTDLREASWIINGYLLVYIVTMPLAGRLTDLWGARRLFLVALTVFTIGSLLAGLAQSLDQLIAARLVQAVGGGSDHPGRHCRRLASLRWTGPAQGARRNRRPYLPGHGRRTIRRRGRPRDHPSRNRAGQHGHLRRPAGRRRRAGMALGLLRQRPGRDLRSRHRLGGGDRLGHAAPAGQARSGRGGTLQSGPGLDPGRDHAHRQRGSGLRRPDGRCRERAHRRRHPCRAAGDLARPPPRSPIPGPASLRTASSRPRP